MAFIAPRSLPQPQIPKLNFWPDKNYPLNGGLNLADLEFELSESQTSKVVNMWYLNGELDKRWGQDYLLSAEAPELVCYSTYKYLYKGFIIKHTGTKLYKQDPVTGILTQIFTGLNAAESKLFKYNGNIYLKQVGKYVQWDGVTASNVVPYIPTVIINRTPTGGGNANEGYNRLGAGFRNSFNGTGAATIYTLTDSGLDATTITCTVGGVAKVEGVDFTVVRATGVVTFSVAPALGTNNVVITAYKTVTADINSILNCLAVKAFGGQNDNRLFFGNNGTGYYYWTGISSVGVDPTYFPLNNYNIVGLTDENITAFAKQNNSLMILKPREIYGVDYSFNGTTGVFDSYPVHDSMGCDCPDTVQMVNNNTVFLSTEFGVCVIQSTNVGNQRNVYAISRNIDARLLFESNLTLASSIEFDGKYWLVVNDKAYVWDYFTAPYYESSDPDASAKRLSWWYFTGINAKSFVIEGDQLFYGDRTSGKTIKFITDYGLTQYSDFGLGYASVYRYPYRMIGNGLYEFTVKRGTIGVRGDRKTEYNVTYFTNDDILGELETDPIKVGSFAWDTFTWDTFTWGVMGPYYPWPLVPSLKNIQYFAVEFSNNISGKAMIISSIKWQYSIGRLIK